jgi:hypothetical protein
VADGRVQGQETYTPLQLSKGDHALLEFRTGLQQHPLVLAASTTSETMAPSWPADPAHDEELSASDSADETPRQPSTSKLR